MREAQETQAQMEEKLANGLRDLEAERAEASAHPRPCPEPSTPRHLMEVDPNEEVIRLRARVAELQSERHVQEADSSRSKKARTTALSLFLVMSSLIEAADSALKEAGRGAL